MFLRSTILLLAINISFVAQAGLQKIDLAALRIRIEAEPGLNEKLHYVAIVHRIGSSLFYRLVYNTYSLDLENIASVSFSDFALQIASVCGPDECGYMLCKLDSDSNTELWKMDTIADLAALLVNEDNKILTLMVYVEPIATTFLPTLILPD